MRNGGVTWLGSQATGSLVPCPTVALAIFFLLKNTTFLKKKKKKSCQYKNSSVFHDTFGFS